MIDDSKTPASAGVFLFSKPNLTRMKNLIRQHIISVSFSLCGIGLILFVLSQFFTTKAEPSCSYNYSYSEGMSAKGISSVEFKDNRKIFELETDQIKISKKKVGVFRIGFLKIAEINKLKINCYLDPDTQDSTENILNFDRVLFNNNALKSLSLDSIREIKIKNIEINLFKKDELISSIKSDSAGIGFYKKGFVFSGNVFIRSNNRSLNTQSILWLKDKNQFNTTDNFLLTTDASIIKGKGLSCDYMLDDIHFVSVMSIYTIK